MTCIYCGGKRFKRRTVDFPVYQDGKIVGIIRDIEADVCEQCGEAYFDEGALERVERERKQVVAQLTTTPSR